MGRRRVRQPRPARAHTPYERAEFVRTRGAHRPAPPGVEEGQPCSRSGRPQRSSSPRPASPTPWSATTPARSPPARRLPPLCPRPVGTGGPCDRPVRTRPARRHRGLGGVRPVPRHRCPGRRARSPEPAPRRLPVPASPPAPAPSHDRRHSTGPHNGRSLAAGSRPGRLPASGHRTAVEPVRRTGSAPRTCPAPPNSRLRRRGLMSGSDPSLGGAPTGPSPAVPSHAPRAQGSPRARTLAPQVRRPLLRAQPSAAPTTVRLKPVHLTRQHGSRCLRGARSAAAGRRAQGSYRPNSGTSGLSGAQRTARTMRTGPERVRPRVNHGGAPP